jgi:LPS export ABC transporter protein LptC
MIKNPRNLLWLMPVLLFVTSPLWKPALTSFLQPRGVYDPSVIRQPTEQQQSFVMDAITITMSSWGRVEWVINAKKAFTAKSDNEIGMIGVDALYTGDEKEQVRIISDRGIYTVDESHLVLIDNVVVDRPVSQQKMYTDLLHYYSDKKMIISPGKVEIRGPDFTIRSGRLEYDLVSKGYDFSNRVICEF